MKIERKFVKNWDTGVRGEQLACNFLVENGYKILARNFHGEHGEIDIIAEIETYTVFIEVKTRTFNPNYIKYGRPADAVNRAKQERYLETAIEFQQLNQGFPAIRFDIIEVILPGKNQPLASVNIKHIKNAFV